VVLRLPNAGLADFPTVDYSAAFRGRSIRFAQGLKKINSGPRKKLGRVSVETDGRGNQQCWTNSVQSPETVEVTFAPGLTQTKTEARPSWLTHLSGFGSIAHCL
jgi:hypothetical protein